MTDIKLGQSISASFASTDAQSVDPTNPLTSTYANEYNLPGLDSFRQLNIRLFIPEYARPTGN